MTTSNPAFSGKTFDVRAEYAGYGSGMTISGTVNKAGILMICVLATAAYAWNQFYTTGDASTMGGMTMIGAFGGLIAAVVTIFKKEWSPVTAPVYALFEGLLLGSLSAMLEVRYPGIAIESVGLTFGTCFALLLAYRSGLIKPTQKFQMGVIAATGGIAILYFATMMLGFFHVQVPGIFGNGPVGIIFSLAVVCIAALNLILDFNMIEQGALRGAPKYMEWYGAFGLMVTLIWLYLEIIRLVAKLRSDRR
jgi:uncharacterized YccA/Bax inhibitor family protein